MLDYIGMITSYHRWAQRKLWQCVLTVSDEDFVRPVAYSLGSLHQQMVHMMWVEALWYARIHSLPRPSYTTDDVPTRDELRTTWDAIEAQWLTYLEALTPVELSRMVTFMRGNGEQVTMPVWQILTHLVNHGTDHRGQVLRLIHDAKGQTFEQDMFFYLQETNAQTAI
ncbi:DinB family protein [Phototrophicus methaneseepsis]|uniref:DinB family protein n=1 Tax=Phototrophicus methaneseepsis TaxID=2710758 RepID=A0A7S8E8W5_9CHLR|nr:DinB family protein [Phototrophicus methaneseepsis]QPC82433.1 DinB family protein [Phototrophicus methaneseepsis]